MDDLQFSFDTAGGSHAAGQFNYDALEPKGRRKAAPAQIVREDVHVNAGRRTKLQANARDLARNFSAVAWMIRRHLDYCATFGFQCKTKDRGLEKEIETLMEMRSRPLACDRGGRFSREKMFRYLEAARMLDGDVGLLRLRSGHSQILESDLIKDPPKQDANKNLEWVDGVQIDYAGLPLQYAIHGRTKGGSGTEWQRNVPAQNFALYGCFERSAANQIRGISPIVASLNQFRDVYENIDFAQVKAKLSQLFALALLRKSEAQGLNEALPTADEQAIQDGDACEDSASSPREFDLSGGPTVLDLDPDEDVKLIESNTPATEFQTFMETVLAIALKCLDIPYSFYNERFTNYSGSRTAWLHYERACGDRRADQIDLRRRWTVWQFQKWIADGDLVLPSKMTLTDIPFQWIPRGMPWWKPSEEIVGDIKAIAGGMDNIDRVCQERDRGDPRDNVDANLEFLRYVQERAVEVLGQEAGQAYRINWDAAFAPGTADATV
jgi:capsid protein